MIETRQYWAAEMERMMKLQDTLLKAMAKKITWWVAAEIIGVTDRTMQRWRERLEKDGYAGLADRFSSLSPAQPSWRCALGAPVCVQKWDRKSYC